MKIHRAVWLFVAVSLTPLQAQYLSPRKDGPPQTVPKPGAAGSTNLPAAGVSKPDLKELLQGKVFTNSIMMELVRVSPEFWAGRYEVTQQEYQEVMNANPSQFPGQRNPVDSVSWNDAVEFCRRLTEIERRAEMLPEEFVYTLPTQTQWESLVAGAEEENAVTSLRVRRTSPAPVGSLGANGLDLHDVRGNVWEWCVDPQDKPYRVLRGGGWQTFHEVNLRPEFRYYAKPEDRENFFGFRCVMVKAGTR